MDSAALPTRLRPDGRLDPGWLVPAGFGWPEGLSLRPRRHDDTAALYDLLSQEGFQRNGSLLEPFASPDDVQAFLDGHGAGNFETVAMIDHRIVGYAGLYALTGRQSHVGYFTLAIDESLQGRGIGTALLAVVVETARTLVGLQRLQLTVLVDNARAIGLYRKFGFAIEGRLSRFARHDDGFVDAYLMAMICAPRA